MIRPALPGDVDAIATVWHDAWRDGHLGKVPDGLLAHRRLEDFHARVPALIPVITVGTIDDDVVGFVSVHDDELEHLFVVARGRGTGLAAALLAEGEQQIARGHAVAWLAVASGNARARRFYERQGWTDVAELPYAAQIEGGTFVVPCRRYEKRVDFR